MVALGGPAAQPRERLGLPEGFDTFGDDVELEGVGKREDGPDEGAAGLGLDGADEALIDLEGVDGNEPSLDREE